MGLNSFKGTRSRIECGRSGQYRGQGVEFEEVSKFNQVRLVGPEPSRPRLRNWWIAILSYSTVVGHSWPH